MADIVLYEKEGDIGRIILNKPEKRNAIDLETLKELIKAFIKSAENNDICVIYSANGKDFTVGAGLKLGNFCIDYAFIGYQLKSTHRISGSIKF